MSQMEEAVSKEFSEITELAQQESISEPIKLTPSIQQCEYS